MFVKVRRSGDLLIRNPSVLYPDGSFAVYHNNFELLLEFFQKIPTEAPGLAIKVPL